MGVVATLMKFHGRISACVLVQTRGSLSEPLKTVCECPFSSGLCRNLSGLLHPLPFSHPRHMKSGLASDTYICS